MTNAEQIRQMTDKEMAYSLSLHSCPPGPDLLELCFDASKTMDKLTDAEVYGDDGEVGVDKKICRHCWENWLQQEAVT